MAISSKTKNPTKKSLTLVHHETLHLYYTEDFCEWLDVFTVHFQIETWRTCRRGSRIQKCAKCRDSALLLCRGRLGKKYTRRAIVLHQYFVSPRFRWGRHRSRGVLKVSYYIQYALFVFHEVKFVIWPNHILLLQSSSQLSPLSSLPQSTCHLQLLPSLLHLLPSPAFSSYTSSFSISCYMYILLLPVAFAS